MANYCIMRMQKIKSTSAASAILKHARREIPCKTVKDPTAKNIKITLGDEMRRTAGRPFKEIFKERTAGQKIRKNAVHAVEVVLTFSPGALAPGDPLKKWAEANMSWLEQTFGGRQNIINAVLHLDETTPHIHAMVIPIDERGKLNARAFLGGTSHRMSELQTEYAKAMEPFGLERGISREITGSKHQAHQRWISENAENEATLKAYRATFQNQLEKDIDLNIELSREVAKALAEAEKTPEEPQRYIPEGFGFELT